MAQMSFLAAVMAGALLAPACADGCNGYCWWSTLAARPVELKAVLICRRLRSPAINLFVPLEQLMLFHNRGHNLFRGLGVQ